MALCTQNTDQAAALLNEGKLVAIPTETVYGLAAKASLPEAVKQIFKVKNRPANNPLILHFPNLEAALPYIKTPKEEVLQLSQTFWPGPLTLLLEKSDLVPEVVTAGSTRVAIRVPSHPLTLELLEKLDAPLAAPSANPSGYISPTMALHVEKQLGEKIPMILDGGACKRGIESTILGWDQFDVPTIYRMGSITPEAIANCIGKTPILLNSESKKIEAPGMLSKHYAPKTPTLITNNVEEVILRHQNKKIGLIRSIPNKKNKWVFKEIILSETGNFEEIASNLYSKMHEMDAVQADLLIIEMVPEEGVGIAINDRLRRAASLN
ncbi:L-threonylcarbamoyladenylate synthase [Ascidiimonas sp. W6]|uniref:L-threonylcarbamoyladenylate synthase n=1 Tax=Ascidiimonas meishanensis TaxID=3128903 RepID=UPI0030EE292E